jgi:RND family efflux transporter MFP subunit
MSSFLGNKRFLFILLVAVILAAGGGWYYYDRYLPAQASPPAETIATAQVQRGDLVISASGSGELIPAAETGLGFNKDSVLTELWVQVGDKVRAGDVLARVDDTEAQQAVAKAELEVTKGQVDLATAQTQLSELLEGGSEADILEAEAAVKSAEEALAEAKAGPTEAEIAVAEAAVKSAEEALAEAKAGPTEAEIAVAEAALASAQETYQRLLDGPDEREIEEAELSLSRAKNSLWSAQSSRDATCGQSNSSTQCKSAQVSVLNGEISVRLAEMALEELREPASEAEIQEALSQVTQAREQLEELGEPASEAEIQEVLSQVTQAKEQLEELREGPSEAQIAEAGAQLAQAKAHLEDLVAGPSEEEIAEAEAQVKQAELSLAQAELDLETAQSTLEETTLIAPMDGTVLAVEAQVGEPVSATSIIALADLEEPQVLFWVEETDLMSVALGNAVNIVFEALPDYTFSGEIVRVDPSLVTVDNMPAVQCWASVDLSANPVKLLSGMTVDEVEVVAAEARDVLLVPVQALRELGSGQYAVFVVGANGELEMRPVEVGLKDFVNAEILSGLEVGEAVSTGTAESTEASSVVPESEFGPPGGGMMPFIR